MDMEVTMAIRDDNHQLETESRRKFEALLPISWTFDIPDNDYGIDGIVEVFTDNKTTGKIFNVQLKATSLFDGGSALKLSFSMKALEYYDSLDQPTMIVRYIRETDSFYYIWSNDIVVPLEKQSQETMTIVFENEIKTTEFSFDVEHYIDQYKVLRDKSIYKPFGFKISCLESIVYGMPKEYLLASVENNLLEYRNWFVNSHTRFPIDIEVGNSSISFDFLEHFKMSVICPQSVSKIIEISNHILYGLYLISMKYSNNTENVSRVISMYSLGQIERNFSNLKYLIEVLHSSGSYNELVDLVSSLTLDEKEKVVNDSELFLKIATLFAVDFADRERHKCIVDMINLSNGSSERSGLNHYNLGNYYSREGELVLAIKHFKKALELEPSYNEREYFWKELGGAHFRSLEYESSLTAYNKAFNLNQNVSILPYIVDCNLYLGNYKLALETFGHYFHGLENITLKDFWWIEKVEMIRDIARLTKMESQVRDLTIMTNGVDSFCKDSSINQLKYDALSLYSWFNLAINHFREHEYVDAYRCFRNCMLLDNADMESWKNILKTMINAGEFIAYDFGYLYYGLIDLKGLNFRVETGRIIKEITNEVGENIQMETMLHEIITLITEEQLIDFFKERFIEV